jgi:hypothetical protein
MQKTNLALVLGILIILTDPLLAQNYVRSGFIVLNSGDTLRGFIKDMEWSVNPTVIEFQRTRESEGQRYDVNAIRSFTTSRPAVYEAHQVKYDPDSQSAKNLPQTREPAEWRDEKLFLEVIVSGGTALYRLDDANGRIHFFIKQRGEDQPVELLNRTYLVTVDGAPQARLFEGWKQQLLNYSSDCTSLTSGINSAKYLEPSLKKTIGAINRCRGEVSSGTIGIEADRKPSQFGILAQLFFDYSEITAARTEFGKINYAFGISYEFFSKRRPERISFYNELKYKHISQEGESAFNLPVSFKIQSVKMVNAIRFNYPGAKQTVFWNVGTNLGYRFSTAVQFENGNPFPGDYDTDLEVGIIVGAGSVIINQPGVKGSVELRYELEQSPFGKTSFVGSHALGLVLNVKF